MDTLEYDGDRGRRKDPVLAEELKRVGATAPTRG